MSTAMGSDDGIYGFTCDGCDATYRGRPHELKKVGWLRIAFGRKHHRRELLLCDDCRAHFEPIWKAREAA